MFNLKKKVNSVSNLFQIALEDSRRQMNGHPFTIEMEEEDLFFNFDLELMKIAVKNLLINAMEYSPPLSPIKLSEEILVTEFKISVIDEGSGIPDEMIPFIFEKFYRVPGSKYEGIGLGLTIVKRIVEIHQGKMEVQSNNGKGTIFSLILPKGS